MHNERLNKHRRTRDYRRRQQARAKRRARDTYRQIDAQDGNDTGRHLDPVHVGRRANTRTFRTQEDRRHRGWANRRRADLTAREQMEIS